ncbi:MAG: hypothetical protein AAGH99_05270 [Planctomycetota bacterium]
MSLVLAPVGLAVAKDYELDENGARVLSELPPVGVHPRVFFTAEELPRIKRRLETTDFGRLFKKKVVLRYINSVKNDYAYLADLGDEPVSLELIEKHFKADEHRNIKWGVVSLYAAAYDDAELKDLMSRVITAHCRVLLASKRTGVGGVAKRGTGPGHTAIENFWKNNDFNVGVSWTIGSAGLAVSYDVLYNDMTAKQRDTVRAAIAAATAKRKPYGTGLPLAFAVSNHYGYHGDLAVLLCAIEGEKGFHKPTFNNIRKIVLNYWDASFTEQGICREDAYGPNLGLRAGSRALVALARRGDNVFATQKYRNFLDYLATDFEAFPGGEFLGGASGGPDVLYPTGTIVARYMYPENPSSNYAYRYLLGDNYERRIHWTGSIDFMIYGSDWRGKTNREAELASSGLSLTRFYPERGKLISRSDWSGDALQFTLDARPDAFIIGHDSPSRGNFTMASHGRGWAYSGSFRTHIDSTDHSLVHIDGKAQAWKAPSVDFQTYRESPIATTGSADLKYAYDWQWSPPWPRKNDPKYAKDGWEPEYSDPRDLGWPSEHAPSWLPSRLHGSNTGYANTLPAGNWLYRRPFNPVLKATRATAAVRGRHPYVVIADDLQKDRKPRLYSWYMQIETDLELKSKEGTDFIFGPIEDPAKGAAPRLLVRVLQADVTEGQPSGRVESYVTRSNQRAKKDIKSKRFVIDANAVAPNYKVMLFPHNEGDRLPATSWREPGETLEVKLPGQRDVLKFEPGPDAFEIAVDRL